MNIEQLLNSFISLVALGEVEVYNEFSLQHELGIFLRAKLTGYKVQFERNTNYFGISGTVKHEIDIVVYNDKEKYNYIHTSINKDKEFSITEYPVFGIFELDNAINKDINHIKNEVEVRYNREGSSSYKKDGFLKDLEVLSRIPILYHKVDKYEKEEYGQIEYHQIVLDLPEEEKEQAIKRNSALGSIASQLVSSLYNIYGDVWKIPQCPMSDFVYTLS